MVQVTSILTPAFIVTVNMMNKLERILKIPLINLASLLITASLGASLLGCGSRIGNLPSDTVGTNFIGIEQLGDNKKPNEDNGIAYTLYGGHIDIAHARICADWTNRFATKSFECLMQGNNYYEENFQSNTFRVEFTYPSNWNTLPNKKEIVKIIAVNSAPVFAFNMAIWHEISSWFGYKTTGILSEFNSAFSWEDSYSNLLGCHSAYHALLKDKLSFDNAFTIEFNKELKELKILDSDSAKQASEKVKDKWYKVNPLTFGFAEIYKRNFDIGLKNGYVTPFLVPDFPDNKSVKPKPYPVPNMRTLSKHNFSARFLIIPHFPQKDKILEIVSPSKDREYIEPDKDFKKIMKIIEQEGIHLFGPNVNKPHL